jgi:hypothetical protein
MNWIFRLFRPIAAVKPAAEHTALAAVPQRSLEPTRASPFLPWIDGTPVLKESALSQPEDRLLDALQRVLLLATVPDTMLPRAAELLPQLIGLLRGAQLPLQEIAARFNKDGVLAAEVMRLANSPFYRAQGEVGDTVQAIRLIGALGLQKVIARVVLKPIYRSSAGIMTAGLAAGLWAHSEALAGQTSLLAAQAGQDSFDGYLIGMLHDTGWRIALFALERAGLSFELQPSVAFTEALQDRVHRLFGHAAQGWTITPGFTAFARDARLNGAISALASTATGTAAMR